MGSPFTFGLDPAELNGYLSEHGLQLIKDVGATDYQILYLKPANRVLNVFEGERTALAEVIGQEVG